MHNTFGTFTLVAFFDISEDAVSEKFLEFTEAKYVFAECILFDVGVLGRLGVFGLFIVVLTPISSWTIFAMAIFGVFGVLGLFMIILFSVSTCSDFEVGVLGLFVSIDVGVFGL